MKRSSLYITISYLYIALFLVGCLVSRYEPAPIETPGVIYPPNDTGELPLPLRRWEYDSDHMLLFREGAHDWGGVTPPLLALYNWETGQVRELTVPELSSLSQVAQGPESQSVVYTTFPNQEVILYDIKQRVAQAITTGKDPVISPDAKQLAVWQENKLILIDLETLATEELTEFTHSGGKQNPAAICCMVWSPDGAKLVYRIRFERKGNQGYVTDRAELVVFDLRTREGMVVASSKYLGEPSWSPDGRLIAYLENPLFDDSKLVIVAYSNLCTIGELKIDSLSEAFWSPDGTKIAVVYWVSRLYFVDVEQVFGAPYQELECP